MSITVHVEHPDGVGTSVQGPAPFAVPCITRKCRSSHRFERSLGAGSPNVDIADTAVYSWTASPTLTGAYYLRTLAGTNPVATIPSQPTNIMIDGLVARNCGTTATNIAPGGWWYGDNDSLGYSTIYVYMVGGVDPDTAGLELVAVYGQGFSYGPYDATNGLKFNGNLTYNDATGELSGTDAWLLYGWQSGDRIELSHPLFTPDFIWVEILSKASKDSIFVTAGLIGDLQQTSSVTGYVAIQSEYTQLVHKFEFSGNVRQYTNTDTRPDAPSSVIPYTEFVGPQCCPIFDGNGVIDYTVDDPFNNDTTGTRTITVDAETDTWDGDTYYLSSSGADTNAGTEIAPFGSLAKGLTMLIAAPARSRLLVKRGDTSIPVVSASVTLCPAYSSTTDKLVSTYGSGAKPSFANYVANDTIFECNSSSSKLRVEDLVFPLHQTSTNSSLGVQGSRHLFSRVEIDKTGDFQLFSTSGNPGNWIIMHDCILNSGNSYVAFQGVGSETGPEISKGAFWIGCSLVTNGVSDEGNMRIYPSNILVAYCYIEKGNNSRGTLRFPNTDVAIDLDHTSVLYNYVFVNTTTFATPCVLMNGTGAGSIGFRKFVLIEGNYLHNVNSATGNHGIDLQLVRQVVIRNNIYYGLVSFVQSSSPQNTHWEIYFNTCYGQNTSSRFFHHNLSLGFRDLIVMNNIIRLRGTGANDPIINTVTTGSIDVRPFTHVFNNIFDCSIGSHLHLQTGASIVDYRIDSTGSEATWVSVRPGQTNLGGNSSDALDPQLNAPGSNHIPVAGSPVIAAGKIIANVLRDHRNFLPSSGGRIDLGALQLNAAAEEIDGAYLYENSDFILLEDDSGVLLLESGVSTGLIPNYRRRRV